jgi:trimeric autotransporter adhesin
MPSFAIAAGGDARERGRVGPGRPLVLGRAWHHQDLRVSRRAARLAVEADGGGGGVTVERLGGSDVAVFDAARAAAAEAAGRGREEGVVRLEHAGATARLSGTTGDAVSLLPLDGKWLYLYPLEDGGGGGGSSGADTGAAAAAAAAAADADRDGRDNSSGTGTGSPYELPPQPPSPPSSPSAAAAAAAAAPAPTTLAARKPLGGVLVVLVPRGLEIHALALDIWRRRLPRLGAVVTSKPPGDALVGRRYAHLRPSGAPSHEEAAAYLDAYRSYCGAEGREIVIIAGDDVREGQLQAWWGRMALPPRADGGAPAVGGGAAASSSSSSLSAAAASSTTAAEYHLPAWCGDCITRRARVPRHEHMWHGGGRQTLLQRRRQIEAMPGVHVAPRVRDVDDDEDDVDADGGSTASEQEAATSSSSDSDTRGAAVIARRRPSAAAAASSSASSSAAAAPVTTTAAAPRVPAPAATTMGAAATSTGATSSNSGAAAAAAADDGGDESMLRDYPPASSGRMLRPPHAHPGMTDAELALLHSLGDDVSRWGGGGNDADADAAGRRPLACPWSREAILGTPGMAAHLRLSPWLVVTVPPAAAAAATSAAGSAASSAGASASSASDDSRPRGLEALFLPPAAQAAAAAPSSSSLPAT